METQLNESIIIQKTQALCQAITEQPQFHSLRRQIDAFMQDEKAKTLYQMLSERGEYLQHKQMQGTALTNEEIAEFEEQRDAFINNPVAKGFLDAQQEMQRVQSSVHQYVTKTFELGRVPEAADFESGCCNDHGCGCSH